MAIERTLLHRLKAAPEYLWLLLLVNDITRHTGRFEVAARSWSPVSDRNAPVKASEWEQAQWMAARLRGDMNEDNNPITLYLIDKVSWTFV